MMEFSKMGKIKWFGEEDDFDGEQVASLMKFFPLCPVLKITTGLHDSAQQNAYSRGNRVLFRERG